MNIEQSKKLSIIDFLDKENVTLKKKKGNAYWYLSPFRDEKTASFKVSKKENLWYDYAIKEGGDLVELVKRMYNKQSVSDALAYLASKSIATVDKAIETAIAAKEYTTTKMNDVKLSSHPNTWTVSDNRLRLQTTATRRKRRNANENASHFGICANTTP